MESAVESKNIWEGNVELSFMLFFVSFANSMLKLSRVSVTIKL